VYGLLRTSDSVSPSLTGGDVLVSLIGYGIVYLVMFPAGIFVMARLVGKGPMRELEAESPVSSGRPGQPVEALPRTGGEP
jgi:cytochrome d ubiquinol oxidase subunit I